jgi:hypothetical protein
VKQHFVSVPFELLDDNPGYGVIETLLAGVSQDNGYAQGHGFLSFRKPSAEFQRLANPILDTKRQRHVAFAFLQHFRTVAGSSPRILIRAVFSKPPVSGVIGSLTSTDRGMRLGRRFFSQVFRSFADT